MRLPSAASGLRFDRAVTHFLWGVGRQVSMREVRQALKTGKIRIDGRTRAPGHTAKGGESVDLSGFIPRTEAQIVPEPERFAQVQILLEDEGLLVLNKPSGWPTQPLAPGETGTLLNAAVSHAPAIATAGPPLEGGLVHRLDVGTSGAVIFAKTSAVRELFRRAFSEHGIKKRYLALVQGKLHTQIVRRAIGPGGTPDRVRIMEALDPKGLSAQTDLRVVDKLCGGYAWVEARTHFGRRHQVRAHLAWAGAPIVGDDIYGAGSKPWLQRLALHACQVVLPDGRVVDAPVPDDLQSALAYLGSGGQ